MNTIQKLAQTLEAMQHCQNPAWMERHESRLACIMDGAPSGSGFDSGTTLENGTDGLGKPDKQRIVFATAFHHMDESGTYDGWTQHKVTIYPQFNGYDMHISGRNRNGIKDYIAGVFSAWLDSEFVE